jgi:hypothetical protein
MTYRLWAALAAVILPTVALGQANCAPHAVVMERLADGFGESRQSIGMTGDGAVVEVFASIATGSWTITVTQPGGPTCLVASGWHFEDIGADAPPAGDEM